MIAGVGGSGGLGGAGGPGWISGANAPAAASETPARSRVVNEPSRASERRPAIQPRRFRSPASPFPACLVSLLLLDQIRRISLLARLLLRLEGAADPRPAGDREGEASVPPLRCPRVASS